MLADSSQRTQYPELGVIFLIFRWEKVKLKKTISRPRAKKVVELTFRSHQIRSPPEVNFRENQMEQGPEGMKTKEGKEREQKWGGRRHGMSRRERARTPHGRAAPGQVTGKVWYLPSHWGSHGTAPSFCWGICFHGSGSSAQFPEAAAPPLGSPPCSSSFPSLSQVPRFEGSLCSGCLWFTQTIA